MNTPAGQPLARRAFINCPFDASYRALLRPMLFTLVYLGFTPRIASESLNSAQNRIDKILELVRVADCSIHDLSRCTAVEVGEYSRMNMPFELGLDYAYAYFHGLARKMLILEGRRYDVQKTLSDLSGVDVKCHHNQPAEVVRCLRDWALEAHLLPAAESPTRIWYRFTDFTSDFYDRRQAEGFSEDDLNDMPTPEYIAAIQQWHSKHGR
jgi:hypothetical protein